MIVLKGFTLWFTGLSGAGKTTISLILEEELKQRGYRVQRLDGDIVRQSLTKDLGFSREDRQKNLERVSFVARLLNDHDVIVLAAFISPYREDRDFCRRQIGDFFEMYVECSLDECIRRDVKGLYRKALAGEIKNFTGVSDPYEAPEHPDFTVHTAEETPEASTRKILDWLEEKGLIAPAAKAVAAARVRS